MTNKNENELQSRREFFKSAAKAALPVVGAVILSSLPIAKTEAATGCNDSCGGSCRGGCYTSCYNDCYNHCKITCKGTCKGVTKY